jgi:prevent-host-death family protein
MAEREPIMTKTIDVSDARQHFAEVLNQVFRGQTRVVVEKSGIPVAGIVSTSDLERLRRFEEEREKDFAILDEIGEAFKDVPAAELERQVARALASARRQMRREAKQVEPHASAPRA